jgi:hypothetical protein
VALIARDARAERLERKDAVHLAVHECFARRQSLPEEARP